MATATFCHIQRTGRTGYISGVSHVLKGSTMTMHAPRPSRFLPALRRGAITLGALGALTACTPGTPAPGDEDIQDVMVHFHASLGGTEITCDDAAADVGQSDTTVELNDLRFYVHDVKLITADGDVPVTLENTERFQDGTVALIDLESGENNCDNGTAVTNKMLMGTAKKGTYTGIAFTLGVPAALNHADATTAPAPLNTGGMMWSWQAGHKFLRADFTAVDGDARKPFMMHLGSTACSGDPTVGEEVSCDNENRVTVRLEGHDPTQMPVWLDLDALLAQSDLAAEDAGGAPGCMSGPTDPECAPLFDALGLGDAAQSVFHFAAHGTGGQHDHTDH